MAEQKNSYKIIQQYGVLDEGNAWTLELNLVQINGNPPVLHIGKWSKPEREHKRFFGSLSKSAAWKLREALTVCLEETEGKK